MSNYQDINLKKIINMAPAVTYVIKAYGDFAAKFVSNNITERCGYTVEECLETRNFWMNCLHPDERECVVEGFKNVFTAGTYKHEYRFRKKDGTYLWVLDELHLTYDEEGKPYEIIGSWLDISKQKGLEFELLENEKRLKSLDKLKSNFIATAAHELNTPVASIMGYSELLSDDEMSRGFNEEQKSDFSREIYENSERLTRIIDDILDVSRIETGQKIPLNKEFTSIKRLLEKIISRAMLSTAHRITLEVKPEVQQPIAFDAHRIRQVIDNLLSNSIKYSSAEKDILVVAELKEASCRISVVDQGIGMSEEQVERVFDKFYRADASNTAIRGLGLGMSIAKQIIEQHGGAIWVDSALGKGTVVHFTLPMEGGVDNQ